jgi:transporter family-2 protein
VPVLGLAAAAGLLAGIAGGIQLAVSGAFGRRVGVLEAAAFASVLAAVLLCTSLVVARRGPGGLGEAFGVAPWMWLGGAMSAVLVTGVTFAVPRIGVVATIGLIILGQLGIGVAIDSLGWLGAERIGMSLARLLGLACIAFGAFVLLRTR